MWFKNLKLFAITQTLDWQEDDVEQKLAEFKFRPCNSQELSTMGFSSPFESGSTLLHSAQGRIWITLKKQERILPAVVVNAELAEKVAQIETETGSAVGKKAKQDLKEEIIRRLLPQAFTKNSFTHGFISIKDNLVVVDASADGKAEVFLAMIRKAMTSLPVVPLSRTSIQGELTNWIKDSAAPSDVVLLEEAELRGQGEEDSIVRVKNQPLLEDEILNHIEAGKFVHKLAIEWDESLTAMLEEDLSVKRLKFTDVVKEQNDDIPKEDKLARVDADFTLMSGEIVRFSQWLIKTFDLDQD
ncbi:recombination-associated protein RdgC [Aliiglaciecola sp. 3_MG-2023]|uniref:recombination-associated protein RdgC n=1 Tax=Aliiglaciecola sp. 3_MG-2023 TaxID=3062644 RepID=UPI0026E2CE7B|nr:recombination-associated protein RdgC [Aliiglaciecola sp. 3_MG-2023]MDO6692904.1 recombination-associated protein RdgC [Aliiglaciecola sp. 3_MG-2023]